MPEQIMTASGGPLWYIDSAGAGLVTGSLAVDVTVGDYLSIVGSPNYNLPITGSVQFSNSVPLPISGTFLGSVEVSNYNGSVHIQNVPTVSGGGLFTIEGSVIQKGTWNVGINAGTNLIGSVVADIVGLTVNDYLSIVGSPNYNLPVQLSAGTNIVGSVVNRVERFGSVTEGSIWVPSTFVTLLQPGERQTFIVAPTGSVSTANTSLKIWLGFHSGVVPGRGIELLSNQLFGIDNYTGSVTAITDAGSVLVGYMAM